MCDDCKQEMLTAPTCTVDALIIQGERFQRHRVRTPIGPAGRCGDCGVQRDGYHHLGCDLERCPRCRRQFISCGCSWIDEVTQSLVAVADGIVVHPEDLSGLEVPDDQFPFGDPDCPPTTLYLGQ